ncbi:MAG: CoA pyrophosphatase [Alphaproteobacteria bacterium]|nr:CoA pyrophosphatase [Rhodospirillales bacterium]MCW9046202.1 CoA pyrophosphatase [Alphaproteobacteria bacterium]
MEQQQILSTGIPRHLITLEQILKRFSQGNKPTAPKKPEDRRGDHTLNPGTYPDNPTLRTAAVLVPLIKREEGLTVLLTQRTEHLSNHAGQISFPGGHVEEDDETHEEAALRETEEEVGLDRKHISVIGRLSDYVTRTGFIVTPVVGIVEPPFDIKPDDHEVAEVFEVPLDFFLNKDNHQRHTLFYAGKDRYFWAMPYGDYYVWGATAGMLVNLYDFLMGPE